MDRPSYWLNREPQIMVTNRCVLSFTRRFTIVAKRTRVKGASTALIVRRSVDKGQGIPVDLIRGSVASSSCSGRRGPFKSFASE